MDLPRSDLVWPQPGVEDANWPVVDRFGVEHRIAESQPDSHRGLFRQVVQCLCADFDPSRFGDPGEFLVLLDVLRIYLADICKRAWVVLEDLDRAPSPRTVVHTPI